MFILTIFILFSCNKLSQQFINKYKVIKLSKREQKERAEIISLIEKDEDDLDKILERVSKRVILDDQIFLLALKTKKRELIDIVLSRRDRYRGIEIGDRRLEDMRIVIDLILGGLI